MSLPLQPSKLHASTSVNSGQVPPFSAGWTTVLVFVLFPPPQLALHFPSSHLLTLQSTKNNFNHWILWQRWFDFLKFQLDMISCLWRYVLDNCEFYVGWILQYIQYSVVLHSLFCLDLSGFDFTYGAHMVCADFDSGMLVTSSFHPPNLDPFLRRTVILIYLVKKSETTKLETAIPGQP